MKFSEIASGLVAGKTAWKRGGRVDRDADRDYYRLGPGKYSGVERVTEYVNPTTGRRSEYVRYHRITRRDFERDDWEFGAFGRAKEDER